MNATQEHLTQTQDIGRLVDELKRDGICVIRNLFDRRLIETWLDAFRRLCDERRLIVGGLAAREQGRYYVTLPWTAPFADSSVFAHPMILAVVQKALTGQFQFVQLGADFPILGSDYQEIHRDHAPLFGEGTVTPLYALAVNFPLVDVTEQNGPLQIARGTHLIHKQEGLAKIASGEIPLEEVYLNAGDVVIRTPLALHRGTPNRTETARPMIVMGYVASWLRTEHVGLRIPKAYFDSLPVEVQDMLRCQVVDELQASSPETYLKFKY